MKITIENTSRIVDLHGVPCRVWEGTTEAGVKVVCLIPSIAAPTAEDQSELSAALKQTVPPSDMAVQSYPLRMVL